LEEKEIKDNKIEIKKSADLKENPQHTRLYVIRARMVRLLQAVYFKPPPRLL